MSGTSNSTNGSSAAMYNDPNYCLMCRTWRGALGDCQCSTSAVWDFNVFICGICGGNLPANSLGEHVCPTPMDYTLPQPTSVPTFEPIVIQPSLTEDDVRRIFREELERARNDGD